MMFFHNAIFDDILNIENIENIVLNLRAEQ